MHELGIMCEVIKRVEAVAKQHQVDRVEKIVLQVGEIATVIPHFLRECYPVAVDRTDFVDTELVIEMIPANGCCRQCDIVYHLMKDEGRCPNCHQMNFDELSGREFSIKEIVVAEGGKNGSSPNY